MRSLQLRSPYSWIKPRRVAFATASVRLMTFILAKIAFTCDFTVPSLMHSTEPISLLLFPWAISLSTSISCEVNGNTCFTGVHPADTVHQRFARYVLEQIALRAGLNRTKDIFVAVEGCK